VVQAKPLTFWDISRRDTAAMFRKGRFYFTKFPPLFVAITLVALLTRTSRAGPYFRNRPEYIRDHFAHIETLLIKGVSFFPHPLEGEFISHSLTTSQCLPREKARQVFHEAVS
jgi:hypothetical protein